MFARPYISFPHAEWISVPGQESLAAVPAVTDRHTLIPVTVNHAALSRLTADIAARFVTVERDAVDDAIVDGLRRLAGVLQLDRVVLWRAGDDQTTLSPSHLWTRQEKPALDDHVSPADIPFFASKLASGEAGWYVRIADLSSPADRDACQRNGLTSAAVVPLTASNPLAARGAIVLGSTSGTIAWTPEAAD